MAAGQGVNGVKIGLGKNPPGHSVMIDARGIVEAQQGQVSAAELEIYREIAKLLLALEAVPHARALTMIRSMSGAAKAITTKGANGF